MLWLLRKKGEGKGVRQVSDLEPVSDLEIETINGPSDYPQSMEKLLRMMDKRMERQGWGGEEEARPALGTVYAVDMGDRSIAFGVNGYEGLPEPFQENFPQALTQFSRELLMGEVAWVDDNETAQGTPGRETLDNLVSKGFIGWVTSMEAFSFTTSDKRELREYVHGRSIYDHPHRVEQRVTMYCGVEGLSITIMRTKGQADDEVEVHMTQQDTPEQVVGVVPRALRLLVGAAMLSLGRRYGQDYGFLLDPAPREASND